MKKYPFSNKAMKAILAASIALSPFAASTFSTPVKVEAATNDAAYDLIDYLEGIYSSLDQKDKKAISDARAEFNTISEPQWEAYAKRISEKGEKAPDAEIKLLKDITKVFASVTVLNVKEQLDAFRTNHKSDVQDVFGPEVTTEKLVGFITDVQNNFLNRIKGKDLGSTSNSQFEDYLTAAILDEGTKDENSALFTSFKKAVNVTESINVAKDINGKIDPNGKARQALVNALKTVQPPTGNGGSGGSGAIDGGGNVSLPGGSTTVQNKGNEVITSISDAQVQGIVNAITEKNNVITIKLAKVTDGKIAKAEIAGALFTEAAKKNKNTIVAIETDAAVYKIPVTEIDIASLANQLGVAAKDVKISVYVNVVKADVKNSASSVVEFIIQAEAGDKKVPVTAFSTYVERVLVGTKDFSKGNSVAVRVNDNGTLTSLPTIFDGKKATVKSLTNSKYTVVENNITFKDVKENSWAKGYIETLANKLIVKGKTADGYAPADQMTRAEFTVLLVRALGLPAEKYNNNFKDIKGNEWFNENGEIMAAVEHGLIEGVGNGNFAPKEKITRAQAAVMIERAMNLNFVNYDKSQLDSKKTVADFKDASKLQAWNKKAIEAVYQADIVSGRETKEFDPNGYTQRDEMAKILANFLTTAKLMN